MQIKKSRNVESPPSSSHVESPLNTAMLTLLESLEDLVSIVDENYHYLAVSAGYSKFFGIHNHCIVGSHVTTLHGQERFEQHIKPFLDKALNGEEVSLQFWGENHLGERRFIDSRHTFYNGLSNKAVAIVARDITDQVNAKASLEKERNILSTIINALPSFIFVKDINGVYQRCNREFELFLGKPSQEIIGFSDVDLMSDKSAKYIEKRDQKVLQGHKVRCDENVTYDNGKKRLLDMFKVPFYSNTNKNEIDGLIGVGNDVTVERENKNKLELAALVFETTSEPCFILDKNGCILTANIAAKSNILTRPQSGNQLLSITEFIFCQDNTLSFEQILSTNRQWSGEVINTKQKPYLATLNCTIDHTNIPNNYVLILHDNASSKSKELALCKKAYYDYLTGLPNRLQLESNLDSAIVRCKRQKRKLGLLFIDLDKFKPINDNFGHFEGDKVLIEIASRIKLEMRKVDMVARIGGDEFVVIIDIENIAQAKHVAQKLMEQIEKPIMIQKCFQKISASIGISIYPDYTNNAKELLEQADQAMYKAKISLNSSCCLYDKTKEN